MIYLVIQGKIKKDAEDIYTLYLKSVAPLMKEYGIEVVLVGTGLECEFTNQIHQNNAVLKIKNREILNKFLGDERYLEIKTKYRDKVYQYLNLSIFESRAPRRFD